MHNVAKFAVNRVEHNDVRKSKHGFVARAAEKAPEDALALGRAMRELAVDESAGQHARALAPRHQETEARRQFLELVLVVAKRDRNRRAVGDVQKVPRQLAVHAVEQGAGNIRWSGENHSVAALVSVHLDGDTPSTILGIDPPDM